MTESFKGVFTPLIMPITPDGLPDIQSLRALARFQCESGVDGVWAMGTTAEFASFDERQRAAVVTAIVDEVAGRMPVIANVSDAGTNLAVRHARCAATVGADAIAVTPPYYFPHSQDEIVAHYQEIRGAVDLPLFIYNIPQTVRLRVDLTTAKFLASAEIVAGIKDSQNDLEYVRQLALFVRREKIDFALFAGTRYLIDAALVAGATGVIPSIANAFPDLCLAVFKAAQESDFDRAAELESEIVRIETVAERVKAGSRHAALLGLLKTILWDRGVIACPNVTPPLRQLSTEERAEVLQAVKVP